MSKTMTEILNDADNHSTDFKYLKELVDDIKANKEHFTTEEMDHMKKHFFAYLSGMLHRPEVKLAIASSVIDNNQES